MNIHLLSTKESRIEILIISNHIHTELDEQQQERLVQAMTERQVQPGEIIIKEGEQGDYFYAVDQGKFIASKSGAQKFIYDGTGSFG
jgi:cAMP-dependent protein kinase regulator